MFLWKGSLRWHVEWITDDCFTRGLGNWEWNCYKVGYFFTVSFTSDCDLHITLWKQYYFFYNFSSSDLSSLAASPGALALLTPTSRRKQLLLLQHQQRSSLDTDALDEEFEASQVRYSIIKTVMRIFNILISQNSSNLCVHQINSFSEPVTYITTKQIRHI